MGGIPNDRGRQPVEGASFCKVLKERQEGEDGEGGVSGGLSQDAVDVAHHGGPLGGP